MEVQYLEGQGAEVEGLGGQGAEVQGLKLETRDQRMTLILKVG